MYKNNLKFIEIALLASTATSLLFFFLFESIFFKFISSILLLILSTGYFFLTGFIFNKGKKTIPWFSILIGVIYSTALIGIGFYVNNIPGNNIFISLSYTLLLFVFFPISVFSKRKDPEYFIPHCIRSGSIGLSCLIIWLSDFWRYWQ